MKDKVTTDVSLKEELTKIGSILVGNFNKKYSLDKSKIRFKNHPNIVKTLTNIIDSNVGRENNLIYYFHFCNYMNFYEVDPSDTTFPTAGVNVTTKGCNFYYNRYFIESLTEPMLMYLIIHEVDHLLLQHSKRSNFYNMVHELSNMAQDYVINHNINETFLNKRVDREGKSYVEPITGGYEGIYLPEEYKKDELFCFENVYRWILEVKKNVIPEIVKKIEEEILENQNERYLRKYYTDEEIIKLKSKEAIKSLSGDVNFLLDNVEDLHIEEYFLGRDDSQIREFFYRSLDYIMLNKEYSHQYKILLLKLMPVRNKKSYTGFDIHIENEVSAEEVNAICSNIHRGCKNRGYVSDSMERHINNLTATKKNYTSIIKKATENFMHKEYSLSYRRPSKRIEGLKGKVKQEGSYINAILDTSGSMFGDDSIETVLSTIYRDDVMVNLYQIDCAEVKNYKRVKSKSEFKKLKLEGGGGTELQPAINAIKNNKDREIRKGNLIILTDGYVDSLDLGGFDKVLIITVGADCPISVRPKNLNVVRINEEAIG